MPRCQQLRHRARKPALESRDRRTCTRCDGYRGYKPCRFGKRASSAAHVRIRKEMVRKAVRFPTDIRPISDRYPSDFRPISVRCLSDFPVTCPISAAFDEPPCIASRPHGPPPAPAPARLLMSFDIGSRRVALGARVAPTHPREELADAPHACPGSRAGSSLTLTRYQEAMCDGGNPCAYPNRSTPAGRAGRIWAFRGRGRRTEVRPSWGRGDERGPGR
jgi:hypothetical protein